MSTQTILIIVGIMLVIGIAMALVARRKPRRRGTGGLRVSRPADPKKRL